MKKLLTFLILVFALSFACRDRDTQTSVPDQRLSIESAPVTRMDMVDTVSIYGQVKLRQEAFLASQFDGRMSDFTLLTGDVVVLNDRVGTIIPAEREALLQIIQNVDGGMRSMLEKQAQSIPLYSPMSGVVLEVQHHSGDVVQKGEAIAHIGDLKTLDVYGDLPIKYLPLVSKMNFITITFLSYPHEPIRLPIKTLSGQVDQAKQTLSVRLELANPTNEYRPGMLVQLVFPDRVHKATLVIPRAALLEEEGIFSVFVVHGQKVEKRVIETGILQDNWVEVISGLQEGEQVATQKAYSLTDGLEVVVE